MVEEFKKGRSDIIWTWIPGWPNETHNLIQVVEGEVRSTDRGCRSGDTGFGLLDEEVGGQEM